MPFLDKRQFLLQWLQGLVKSLDNSPFQWPGLSPRQLPHNPLDDDLDISSIVDPRKDLSFARRYVVSVDLITKSDGFIYDLFLAIGLIPVNCRLGRTEAIIDALKSHILSLDLKESEGYFSELYRHYDSEKARWEVVELLFLILFLKESLNRGFDSILSMDGLCASKSLQILPPSKGYEALKPKPIEICKEVIGVLHRTLSNLQFENSSLSHCDSSLLEQLDGSPRPLQRTSSRRIASRSVGPQSMSLDTYDSETLRSNQQHPRRQSRFEPWETKMMKQSIGGVKMNLERERKQKEELLEELRSKEAEISGIKSEKTSMKKNFEQTLKKKDNEVGQLKQCLEDYTNECNRRDQRVSELEQINKSTTHKIFDLEKMIDQLSKNLEISNGIKEDLLFQHKEAQNEIEKFRQKWIEALNKLAARKSIPRPQPIFNAEEVARYLQNEQEAKNIFHINSRSVIASEELQTRMTVQALQQRNKKLERMTQIQREVADNYEDKLKLASDELSKYKQLSKNYERLFKIYYSKTTKLERKEGEESFSNTKLGLGVLLIGLACYGLFVHFFN